MLHASHRNITSTFIKYTVVTLLLLAGSAVHAAKAPNFSLSGMKANKSKTVSLKKYRNKVIYVDFWASWCGPCKQSFPWMIEMQERYGSQGFKVIGISLDENKADAINFLKKMKVNFDIAFDPAGKIAEKYRLEVMPSSYLVDRRGNLIHAHKGFKNNDKGKIENIIQKLVSKKR